MNTAEALVLLLDAAIHGKDSPFDASVMNEVQWGNVLGAAAAQNVHTLLFDVLPQGIPENVMEVWRAQTGLVEQYNRRIASVAAAQEKTWKHLGLRYAMLKGLSVASLYPHPEHRGSGDIDWYFADAGSWSRAFELAERNAERGVHRDSDGDMNYIWKGVVVEHHRDWSHLSSKRNRSLAGPPDIIDGRLSPEDTLLMLNAHILHHLSTSGAGLKQFADLAVAYQRYCGVYDMELLAVRLRGMGLEKWTALLHAVLLELTGISPESLPVPPAVYGPDTEAVLRMVFSDGSFGLGGKRRFNGVGRRISLLLCYSPREVAARYRRLISGRFHK